MRVLYFHQHFSTPQGATGTRSYENAQRLLANGHEVVMVCGSYKTGATGLKGEFVHGRRSGLVDGIVVIELQLEYENAYSLVRRSGVFLKFALRSVRIAFTEKYDILFATSTPLTASIPGIFARLLRRKPFVFEVRDLWPELPKAMGVVSNPLLLFMLSALEKVAYLSATSCIGLSPGIVEGIKRRSQERKSIALIPNGCDESFLKATNSGGSTLPRRSPGNVVAVFTGAHGLANGLHAVLDAAAELQNRQRADIDIVFIGDGLEKPALIARCENEKISNVTFLDPIPKTQLRELLTDADIGLMILANVPAFYYGTSPNKFFDYIALGLPVLTNYPGWLAGMIEEERVGLVVPPEDPGQFVDALTYLADDPDLRRSMGGRAREFAKRQFDRGTLGEQFVKELERVMAL